MRDLKQLLSMVRDRSAVVAVVGLGYVGMPLAVAFAKQYDTIGFDVNAKKVEMYKKGIDVTNEVGDEALRSVKVHFTSNPAELGRADIYIVAVPTPIDEAKAPDFKFLEAASRVVGENIKKGAVVAYESTVHPGATEDICIPIIEQYSGLTHMRDFFVGYSPERINPSDKVHRLETIVKVVSGCNEDTLNVLDELYGSVVKAGTYRAASIKVAEAAKVIENAQRDINIAYINEISMIFHKMGIDTAEVLDAAATKWNFLKFAPGLVGGHCIGVDPYYLAQKAQMLGHYPQIILAGRRINDGMGPYIASQTVKMMIAGGIGVKGARVLVLGITFKENVPDCRNTKVVDIVNELKSYGADVVVADCFADREEALGEYGIELIDDIGAALPVDAVVAAVAHDDYARLDLAEMAGWYRDGNRVLVDVKGMFSKSRAAELGFNIWRL